MEEQLGGTVQARDCDLDAADAAAFMQPLGQAAALSEPGQVSTDHVGWSLWGEPDQRPLEDRQARIHVWADSGRAAWDTLSEMDDACVQWDART